MDNNAYSNELQHWGVKGMRWGQRRYQNKDGTLTALGKKRYNKELEKVKADEAKLKEEKKIAANKKRTQTKIDKLEAKKKAIEEERKAMKGKKSSDDNIPEETPEQKKARLLKSTDPNELYKNKDMFTNAELQERVNRINLEAQLQSRTTQEHSKSGLEYVESATNTINKATNLYRSVDNAYSTAINSSIVKTIAKQLDIDLPGTEKKKPFNLKDFYDNIANKSDQEVQSAANRIKNQAEIEKALGKNGNKSLTEMMNGSENNTMSMDDIKSYIDDAVSDAMSEREKG